ncbi:hypothetical protein [Gordonia phthalatica]|uniref:Uncharacterized protein n=1 Tax=Gordonia phthalatica TaxID=1136941 RepID=A0A0N9NMN1_9ACTN|nr:hypothetical protein [Gordonia phthalatica]ALG87074.1 hypothetical protein ACH46_20125 [Gordonia phthalatica]
MTDSDRQKINSWAHSYNGYTRLDENLRDRGSVVARVIEEYEREGSIPEWAGIDVLRGWAFYLARSHYHTSYGQSLTEMHPEILDIAAAIDARPWATAADRCPTLDSPRRGLPVTRETALFTTEPMLTRALAAEIRHAPFQFLREVLLEVGTDVVDRVECEGVANLDIVVHLASGRTIGIEAKVNHQLTEEQFEKELEAVDELVLLVLHESDAERFASRASVVTWEWLLYCFPDSRLRLEDVLALPAQKVAVERALRPIAASLAERLGTGWTCEVNRGGSGMSAITIGSPEFADGRQLRGQIQVVGRGMPVNVEDIRYEFHIGIGTDPTRTDFPSAERAEVAPGWVRYLEVLRDDVVAVDRGRYRLRAGRASNGRSGVGKNKSGLVKKFLPGDGWLAQGYYDWALGPKSEPVEVGELDALADTAQELFAAWYDAARARTA